MAALSRSVSNIRITLGALVNFQASVHSAIEDRENAGLSSLCVHENTEHKDKPASPIKRRDFCPVCDNDDKTTFRKGQLAGDSAVMLTAEQVEAAKAHGQSIKGALELTTHTTESVNGTFPTGKSYYLNAKSPADAKLYALVAKTLGAHPELTLIGEASLRGAAMLYQVVADGGTLIMRQLARPETVRERPVVEAETDEKLGPLLEQLLTVSAEPFDPQVYESKRAKALAEALAEAPTVAATSQDGVPAVANVDLVSQLEAKLAALGQSAAPAKPVRKPRAKKVA
jgi:non-homologous end joining protein Ku